MPAAIDADRTGTGDQYILADQVELQRAVGGVSRTGPKKAASSEGMASGIGQRLLAGTTTYSAKPPSRLTPIPFGGFFLKNDADTGAVCRRGSLRQTPQTTWASADTRWPSLVTAHAFADVDDPTDELMPDYKKKKILKKKKKTAVA